MKTFWSVKYYNAQRLDNPGKTAWFDNLEEAKAFAEKPHTYRDEPVRHRFSRPYTISVHEELVTETRNGKSFWVVKYRNWGADGPSTALFKNYDEAKAFSEEDYTDNPTEIFYSDPEDIFWAEYKCD